MRVLGPEWLFLLIFVVGAAVVTYFNEYDDTDDHVSRTRSGLGLRTDHGTGCQYLVEYGVFGDSITPRLNEKGKPMCRATQ